MMGSFVTRALAMALGYAYPAYECFKTVEKNKPEVEQLRFWCQYWILVAVMTVLERFGDAFISWLPMYSEAKLAFFIYLWYPKTRGTTYVYDTFFQPIVSKHEPEIDRTLVELKTRAGDIMILYWQKAATYGQTRFFEVLQYIASQSQTSRPRPTQDRQPPAPAAPSPGIPPVGQRVEVPESHHPPSPAKNQARDPAPEAGPTPVAPPAQPAARSSPAKHGSTAIQPGETEPKQAAVAQTSGVDSASETIVEEPVKLTRGRLRKIRSGGPPAPPP